MAIILNLVVFVTLILLVWKSSKSSSAKIFLGLSAGIVFGIALQTTYGTGSDIILDTLEWTNIAADGYLNLLKVVTIPLVLVTMISAVSRTHKISSIGKIAGLIFGVLFITALISSIVAVGVSELFNLSAEGLTMGDREVGTGAYFTSRLTETSNASASLLITNYIPSNIFSDLTGARPLSVLAIIVFSILFGFAAYKVIEENPDYKKSYLKMLDVTENIVARLLKMIMVISPFGVMALMTKIAATMNINDVIYLGKYIIAAYVAITIMFIIHAGLLNFAGYSPRKFFKAALPVLMVGGASSSATSCVPLNIEAQTNKLGVPKAIAVISAAFGATNGQNACGNIFPTMLAIMIAPMVGITVDFEFIIMLIMVVSISSFGIAGFGGGWPNAVLVVFPIMGLPIEMAGVLIAIDPLIDKARTALNINGAMVAGVITSQIIKAQDIKTVTQPAKEP